MSTNLIVSIEMHTQNVWETDIRILGWLRSVLANVDAWTTIHEGHFEEYTRPSGVYFSPDGGYTFPNIDNDDPDLDAVEDAMVHLESLISEWELELSDYGIAAYPDGESGMYFVEHHTL